MVSVSDGTNTVTKEISVNIQQQLGPSFADSSIVAINEMEKTGTLTLDNVASLSSLTLVQTRVQ